MKNTNKKRKISLLLLIVAIFAAGMTSHAATKKDKALTAYRSALEKNYFRMGKSDNAGTAEAFCLLNLNNDTIPELFVSCTVNGGRRAYMVYTYKNGKIAYAGALFGGESMTQVHYYKKAKILREDWERWERNNRQYWQFKSSILKSAAQKIIYMPNWDRSKSTTSYDVDGKSQNLKAYNAKVKKLVGSEKAVAIDTLLKKNTAANRNKYIKTSIVELKLNKYSATLTKGKTLKLKATVTGSSSKVKWSSSNTKVAKVSSSGKVTAKKAGTATITAKVGKVTAKCKITVKTKETAKGKNAKAHAAYKKALAGNFELTNGSSLPADAFYLFDLNKDGVDELLIQVKYNSLGHWQYFLFVYNSGKVQCIGSVAEYLSSLTWYSSTKTLKRDIMLWGSHSTSYYQMSKNALQTVAEKYENSGRTTFELNGKTVNSSKYNNFVDNVQKGKAVNLSKATYTNNAANRNKYCK